MVLFKIQECPRMTAPPEKYISSSDGNFHCEMRDDGLYPVWSVVRMYILGDADMDRKQHVGISLVNMMALHSL